MNGVRTGAWWVLFILLAMLSSAVAQVPDRLLARDAVRYLDLNPEQVTELSRIHSSWLDYLAIAAKRAGLFDAKIDIKTKARKEKPDAAMRRQQHAELETICAQSQARRQKTMVEVRALLNPAQVIKLAALEEALTMMPIVQSAESVNFLSGALRGPPMGMPDGTIEVEFNYIRSPVIPLPGCRATPQVVRPGVELSKGG